MELATRRRMIAQAAQDAGADAVLVKHLVDVRYLCNFTGSSAVLILHGQRAVLFTDGRYAEQAHQETKNVEIVIATKAAITGACEWIDHVGVERTTFDPAHTTISDLSAMREAISVKRRRAIFQAKADLVGSQREIKDASEISLLRKAASLGCTIFESTIQEIVAGTTEVKVALALEQRARSAGAEGMSFESIVASGARSALPHARPTLAKIPRRGFVVLDFGVVWHGYCSDMTRTVHLGRPSPAARAVYDSVLEAQMTAVARVGPGVTAGEIDEAARSVLRRAKLDSFFKHSTGHGVGLEVHERPRIAAEQKQELKPGMIITVEPGVYLRSKFGIRIEDMILVTPKGHEVLTSSTKALIEL